MIRDGFFRVCFVSLVAIIHSNLISKQFTFVGWLYDITGHYPASFFLGFGSALIAALVMVPIRNYRYTDTHKTWWQHEGVGNQDIASQNITQMENTDGGQLFVLPNHEGEMGVNVSDGDFITHM